MEKQLRREEIYNGKVIKVIKDDVVLDNGVETKREVVLHNGGACVAIKDLSDNRYFMVKQYRYAHGQEMLEFCAGKIEIGEDPDSTVLREAEEEVGYSIKNVHKFGYMIPTCGYSSEKIYLYYAEADKKVGQNFDEDEYMNVYKYSYEEIKEMIKKGEINDGKTICCMYHIERNNLDK